MLFGNDKSLLAPHTRETLPVGIPCRPGSVWLTRNQLESGGSWYISCQTQLIFVSLETLNFGHTIVPRLVVDDDLQTLFTLSNTQGLPILLSERTLLALFCYFARSGLKRALSARVKKLGVHYKRASCLTTPG